MTSARLPDFPWDSLASYAVRARAYVDGVVDLSVGTPVDPTPDVVQVALCRAANAPGYPATWGTSTLRDTVTAWLARRHGVTGLDPGSVIPTIGSKELVAWLPTLLGLGPDDTVVIPELAYPTYDVGARLAGARVVRADSLTALGPMRPKLIWVNSPANPTGAVLPSAHLAKVVAWARERGAVVASDECYLDLSFDERPVSILHPDVCGDSHEGLLAVHSASKHSNVAGYRAGFIAGDPALAASLLEIRKHAGMIVPAPVQAAMVAVFGDDDHIDEQRGRYSARRDSLRAALLGAGFNIEHSAAGLYLWATRGEDCWATVGALADLGILVAPGTFYGPTGGRHVRIALTATDERVAQGVERLRAAV